VSSTRPSVGAEYSQLLCRVRPSDKPGAFVHVSEKEARVEVSQGSAATAVNFDKVYADSQSEDQQEFFRRLQPAVLSCLSGSSCTILAHGGPQSGKSYALSGLFTSGELHGIAPRAIQSITEEMERMGDSAPAVEASFFELQQDALSARHATSYFVRIKGPGDSAADLCGRSVFEFLVPGRSVY
ncbi:Kifc2, partial [Symbiodinium natans]